MENLTVKGQIFNTHCICIGNGAGMHLTNESYQLCIKCDELEIDIQETMTEREYELISKATTVLCHYYEKEKPKTFPLFHGTCDA